MAAAAYDLCTVDEVKEFLHMTKAGEDNLLQSIITRASKSILNYTGREFAPTTNNEPRAFSYFGGGSLSLSPYDLRAVDSMVIDSDLATTITLESTDYVLQPKPAKDEVYGWVLLPNHDLPKPYGPQSQREVTVTGDWGFSVIPEDVKHWAINTVVVWFRRDSAAFSTAYPQDTDQDARPEALPSAVMMGLSHYRRRHVA